MLDLTRLNRYVEEQAIKILSHPENTLKNIISAVILAFLAFPLLAQQPVGKQKEDELIAKAHGGFATAFDPESRPLWVLESDSVPIGWLSLRSFYGRPAYHRTVESAVYVAPEHQRAGIARKLLTHALEECPRLGIANVLGFVFVHNMPSVTLFESHGFHRWGLMPKVCEMDGIERDVLILGRRI